MPSSVDPAAGVNFPLREGERGSTHIGKQILAEAVRELDPVLASGIEAEQEWRTAYPDHLVRVTEVEARSASAALSVARIGLAEAHRLFVVVGEGSDQPLRSAVEPGHGGPQLDTAVVAPRVRRPADSRAVLRVPYGGDLLSGDSLVRQLDDWVARGIVEPTFRESVGAVVRHPDWLDLSDQTFALLGAGAAMGPYAQLMRWGARVAAVDIPRPRVWERLVATAHETPGRLLVPVRPGGGDLADAAGVDLLTETGSALDWVAGIEGPLTIGNYGYIPGAGFVRLSVAFDLLFSTLAGRRADVGLAYLATPSDAFSVPRDAVAMAVRRRRAPTPTNLLYRGLHAASGGRWFQPTYAGRGNGQFGLVNAFIVEQGPNYAVAKRLQRWRVMAARAQGVLTSVHVAPPTRTESVLQNPAMGERQRLNARIGLEAFDAAASQALGAAILVHDLRNPDAPANPSTPMGHPHEAFMFAANPGGRWRGPYDPNSSVAALARIDRLRPGRSGRS